MREKVYFINLPLDPTNKLLKPICLIFKSIRHNRMSIKLKKACPKKKLFQQMALLYWSAGRNKLVVKMKTKNSIYPTQNCHQALSSILKRHLNIIIFPHTVLIWLITLAIAIEMLWKLADTQENICSYEYFLSFFCNISWFIKLSVSFLEK